ncbi:hypothetical protein BD408DRAFT_443277 [Parasitella parasitica]|nr:hypothetical protein BD408DRAFT_443277 [Parasitella parasitica]
MTQEYQTDTVEDLYNEIEHLIDVPFEKFSHDVQQYQISDSAASRAADFDQHFYQEEQHDQQRQADNHSNESADIKRPILIESDSDEIEEEALTPDQQYSYITCYRCNTILPFESNNTLKVDNGNVNMCPACVPKKRTRSRSFISEVADKLKNLGSGNNSISLLSPSTARLDRRKSMSSINDASTSSLAPSPTPSRPSSRASSFIEDVKQFLSPLSRKSSRNSMYQEYQQNDNASQQGPSRKTSHNSLFDAMNICKPKQQKSPSYERRLIDNSWAQDDNEVMNIYQQQQHAEALDAARHIPIRRKQIKKIESRQDRVDIYNNAYLDCMQASTELIPWIVKQTQKGPPDDWFSYTPPAAKEPKKVLGLFKKKAKSRGDARAQQLQLGDELFNRSAPLLNSRFNNSNLSVSPGVDSLYMDNSEMTQSPLDMDIKDYEDTGEEYFDSYHGQTLGISSVSPNHNAISSPLEDSTGTSQCTQPVSILKKTNSNRNSYQQPQSDYAYEPYYEDDIQDQGYQEYYQNDMYDDGYDYEYEQSRHYAPPPAFRQRDSSFIAAADGNRYNSSRQGINQQDYHVPLEPPRRRSQNRSRSRSRSSSHNNEDYYYQTALKQPAYYDEQPSSYYDQPLPPVSRRERDYYQPTPTRNSRRSSLMNGNQSHDYYASSAMIEEWELTLDDLCDLFPRLDRHYINDFLRSAQGDFITAKNMIMEMIMEVR